MQTFYEIQCRIYITGAVKTGGEKRHKLFGYEVHVHKTLKCLDTRLIIDIVSVIHKPHQSII